MFRPLSPLYPRWTGLQGALQCVTVRRWERSVYTAQALSIDVGWRLTEQNAHFFFPFADSISSSFLFFSSTYYSTVFLSIRLLWWFDRCLSIVSSLFALSHHSILRFLGAWELMQQLYMAYTVRRLKTWLDYIGRMWLHSRFYQQENKEFVFRDDVLSI